MHQPAIDARATRNDSVGWQLLIRHAEVSGPVLSKGGDFLERVAIYQQVNALARSQLPSRVLLFNALVATALQNRAPLRSKFPDVPRHSLLWFNWGFQLVSKRTHQSASWLRNSRAASCCISGKN